MTTVRRKASPEEIEVRSAQRAAALDEIREIEPDDRDAFVAYVDAHKGCTVKEACREVGVRRRDVRALLAQDKEFDEEYRTARGWGPLQILASLKKLGIDGVDEPLVSAGKLVKDDNGDVVYVRKYSDRAAIALFNAMTPEGKAAAAGRFGLEIGGAGVQVKVQAGVALSDVFAFMQQHALGPAPADAGEVVGELVEVTDEPLP